MMVTGVVRRLLPAECIDLIPSYTKGCMELDSAGVSHCCEHSVKITRMLLNLPQIQQ